MPRTDTRMRTAAAAVVILTARYYARRPFTYAGQDLERGQVFNLAGVPNDEKLIRLNYISEVADKHEVYICAECRRQFVQMGYRDMHGKEAHRRRPRAFASPEDEDKFLDEQEKRLDREAPLAFENTIATREAS